MPTQPKSFLTEEQYLEMERAAEFKSEFFQGEMFAMAGAGLAHNLLVGNAVSQLNLQLRGRPCIVLPSDMRIRVPRTRLYTYPDVTALCEKPEFLDARQDTLLNPTLIIEVLSPSTEAYDRGRKFDQYGSIPSLQEYLLVATDRIHVDRYVRHSDGWMRTSFGDLESVVELRSVMCNLSLAELYDKIDFTA